MSSPKNDKQQLAPRKRHRAFRAVHPTEREVLLATLLLQVVDALGEAEVISAEWNVTLYNEVKAIAEPIVRSVSRETLTKD